MDEMLRYFAANTALVNLDHYQGDKKHNYYLYEENGVFSILPWDYNMSFGGYSGGGGRKGQAADAKTEESGQEATNEDDEKAADQKDAAMANGIQLLLRRMTAEFPGDSPNMNGGAMMDMSSNFMNESIINFSITEPVSGTALEIGLY